MEGRGRRVAITGYGVVAPCGLGKDAFWQGLLGPAITGTKAIFFENWDPSAYYASPKESRRADAVEQFAMASATEAFEHAGKIDVDPRRFGIIYGTGIGGLRTLEEQIELRLEKGERPGRVSPFLVPMMMGNASGAAISMRYGLQGPNETICTACAAATHAIGYAARLIAWGRCDAMVTGGSEAAGTLTSIAGFNNMTALSSTGSSRPFDTDRDGFVMGEGSATFILEEWDMAVARGATIYGEILGAASTADAHHITAPAPGGTGAINCMSLALDDAHLAPSDIRQINAPPQLRRRGRSSERRVRPSQPANDQHQGRHRSSVGRRRRTRGGRRVALDAAPPHPAHSWHHQVVRRHEGRHCDGCSTRMGTRPNHFEQLRIWWPQRLDHHRARQRIDLRIHQHKHQIALACGLAVQQRLTRTFASACRHSAQLDRELKRVARDHLTAEPCSIEPAEQRQLACETWIGEYRYCTHLSNGFAHQHTGQSWPPREMPGEEPFVAREVP